MTDEQKAAYVNAQAAAAQIESIAMVVANSRCQQLGDVPVYTEDHFRALIDNYGLHHNAVIGFFHP